MPGSLKDSAPGLGGKDEINRATTLRVGEIKSTLTTWVSPGMHIPDLGGRLITVVVQNTRAQIEPRLVVGQPEKIAGTTVSTLLIPVDDDGHGNPGIERRVHAFALSQDPFAADPLRDDQLDNLATYLENPEENPDLIGPLVDPTPDEIGIIAARAARRSIIRNS